MPSGFRLDTDGWTKEFDECKQLAQETLQLIQERNLRHPNGGPEASRLSAAARKKLGTLGVQLDKLLRWLDSPEADSLSEPEKNRRRDLIHDLRGRREGMQMSIKRSTGAADRDALFSGAGPSSGPLPPRETEATAELDNRGLLGLQQAVMRRQDEELAAMEKTVASTKHIALAIGEEVDLQTRLLDDLADDVDVTQSRLKAATAKVKQLMRDSGNCRLGVCVFILIVTLVVVIILTVKLARFL
ncbi:hypothetical protein CHLRE_17g709350v5 [Chlamydomonas reinhardtii]|uniref:Uncharacterized protein n=2 Tax=Chlamydomonas reinhardtii TaxID=3055 RepID=A8IR64_CHLRE|nr:uncharacterized protein CHLRE_17g709350v5 [Chlamydomonas reinhardtii]PNW70184.1 hypothetical protein CHLRE_17g709350v5 [Chlamydomonas reinhardtii]|eukprot:XP_001691539.1 Qc-SNARE protein, Syn8/Syntaxin8-family [Chlamydomonas reinhardtii]